MSAATNDRRLVALRTLRVGTRVAMAEASGLSEPTCWRIETSRTGVEPESLKKYGIPLGISAEQVRLLRPCPPTDNREMWDVRALVLEFRLWELLDQHAEDQRVPVDTAIARLLERAMGDKEERG